MIFTFGFITETEPLKTETELFKTETETDGSVAVAVFNF